MDTMLTRFTSQPVFPACRPRPPVHGVSRAAGYARVFLIGFFLALFGCEQTTFPAAPRAEGTYIVAGGDAYVVVERGTMGDLRLAKQSCFPPRDSKDERIHIDIFFDSGNLQVRHERHRLEKKGWRAYQMEHWNLAPSKDIPGDWDIVRWVRGLHSNPKRITKEVPTILVPSFLHRVEHRDIPDLFKALERDPSRGNRPVAPDQALRLSDEILRTHPDDPFLGLLRLRVLLHAGAMDELRTTLENWRESLESASQPLPRHGFRWVEAQLRDLDIPHAENAAVVFKELVESNEALEDKLDRLPTLLALSKYGAIPYWPGIWDCQVFAQSVRSSSHALLLDGEW